MRSIILIAHNLRSCHNVGSLLRTADGLGLEHVYLTGYTPYPQMKNDTRMPHIALKMHKQIQKTALDAESSMPWNHQPDVFVTIDDLKSRGYTVAALEQTDNSLALPEWKTPDKIALIVGREVEGIEQDVLAKCDMALEIPMLGKKESFNVVQAAAIAMYHCRFS